ncbi:uncharacterized protein [Rutidosis leptorrhynchoides]|uniref:uncharacterized protein n=1 Tax=Rutidosis leptorrhynchoides TaxID=125765 RepID=UPI003A992CAC
MACNFTMIQRITLRNSFVNIRFKLLSFEVMSKKKFDSGLPFLDLIVCDEEGSRIGITIKNVLMSRYEPLLKVQNNYLLRNASVISNLFKGKSKHWEHPCKLMLTQRSTVVNVPANEWRVSSGFKFIPFNDLITCKLEEGVTAEQLTVRSDWTFTRILINHDCEEGNDFIKSILETHANSETTESLAPSSEPAEDPVEAWFKYTTSVDYFDLPFCEPGMYVVHAKIISVLSDDPWWYIGCKKHHKKANPEVTDVDLTLDVDSKYKVSVCIEDLTDTTTVTLFKTQVCKYVTKSAYQLQKSLLDSQDFPDDLDVLIGNKLVFKLDVSNYNLTSVNPNYTVKDVMSEVAYVEKFKTKLEAHKALNEAGKKISHDAKGTPSGCSSWPKCDSTQTSGPVEVGTSTGYTPTKKIIKQEPSGSPVSVKSTTTKAKRNLNPNVVPLKI